MSDSLEEFMYSEMKELSLKAELIQFTLESMVMKIEPIRTFNNYNVWVSDLTRCPHLILETILKQETRYVQNFAYALGLASENWIVNSIKKRLQYTKMAYLREQVEVVISALEFPMSITGRIDGLFYTKYGKIPLEIKSTRAKDYKSPSQQNLFNIQLLAYVKALESPFGLLAKINRDSGQFTVSTITYADKIISPIDKTEKMINEYIFQWFSYFLSGYSKNLDELIDETGRCTLCQLKHEW